MLGGVQLTVAANPVRSQYVAKLLEPKPLQTSTALVE